MRIPVLQERLEDLVAYLRDVLEHARQTLAKARREGLSDQQRRALALAAASGVVCVAFCAFMAWLIGSIAADPSGFAALVEQNKFLAVVGYALVNTLQVFAAFIPGEPLELVAGYLFGTWGGLVVVSAGLALGELVVFCAVKRLGPRFVHLFVSQEKLDELAIFNDPRRLNTITFLMMFIPGTPKDLMTYVVGLTPMRLKTWMLISIPARVLSIVASTVVGDQAAQNQWGVAVAVFALTCLVSVGGMLYYVAISRQARQAAAIEELARREWEAAGRRTNDVLPRAERVAQ